MDIYFLKRTVQSILCMTKKDLQLVLFVLLRERLSFEKNNLSYAIQSIENGKNIFYLLYEYYLNVDEEYIVERMNKENFYRYDNKDIHKKIKKTLLESKVTLELFFQLPEFLLLKTKIKELLLTKKIISILDIKNNQELFDLVRKLSNGIDAKMIINEISQLI